MDGWQATVMILAFIGALVWIVWLIRHKRRWQYAILPLTYFANVIAYNLCTIAGVFNPEFLDIWTHIVRIHSIFIFTGLGYLFLFDPDTIRVMINGGS